MISTVELLRQAQAGGYAVPAFNVFDELSMRSVVAAAEAKRSPAIIQISTRTAVSIGVEWVSQIFRHLAGGAGVPLALHLDHCPDRAVINQVVAAGWSSVLFDASQLDFAQAAAETAEVVQLAHAGGVEVESEIENILGVEDGVGSDTVAHAYTPQAIVAAALEAGVDFIAPQLGTAHGEYRSRPRLQPQRVREFAALASLPVVLHGGSGLTEAEFRQFIEAGVAKINISTAVKQGYLKSALAHLERVAAENRWEPAPLFRAEEAGCRDAIGHLFDVFGSAGRA
ncbi:MAG: class II fructose-bisphosphate aldolase [Bifidobacteriaceae bacterium]|nr:class II fructose-bisphosphate aldolase [Bifidobacteriaceae bacterium]